MFSPSCNLVRSVFLHSDWGESGQRRIDFQTTGVNSVSTGKKKWTLVERRGGLEAEGENLYAMPRASSIFRFFSAFFFTSLRLRSSHVLLVIFMGRAPQYLPFISRMALAQSMGSMKLTKP